MYNIAADGSNITAAAKRTDDDSNRAQTNAGSMLKVIRAETMKKRATVPRRLPVTPLAGQGASQAWASE